jgi:hypothetical protein
MSKLFGAAQMILFEALEFHSVPNSAAGKGAAQIAAANNGARRNSAC